MYNQKHHKLNSFYNHKFGFHINGPRNDAFAEVFRLRPKVVKTLDFSVAVMKQIKKEIPDIFLIGRLFAQPQDFGQLSGGTAKAAQRKGIEMAERILRQEVNHDRHHVNGRPIFSAWESLNEVFPEWMDEDTQKLYDDYQVAFGQKMRAAGLEPIAFNFGQGNGRGQQWLKLYPGTLEFYNYLGFHEYDWPTMDRLHRLGLNGTLELHNFVPGVGQGRGNDGMWRCLRYRRIMNEGIRQRYGNQHTVIITECGMTQGVWGGPSEDLGPWAKKLTVPADIPGGVVPTPIPADDYWQSLLWYNSELMKDDYVLGACLFVTGAAGAPQWETFEHLGVITDHIFAFQKESDPILSNPTPLPPPLQKPASESQWRYTIETRPGLGLLVGDIGLANESIIISQPDGSQQRVVSGSKPEFGIGGFESYAQQPGNYVIEFLDQKFGFALSGQFTKVIFQKVDSAAPAEPTPKPQKKEWRYTIETGRGLGLLVGDIGLAGEAITITKPDHTREVVSSGSKPEFGIGGFEVYAQRPGKYTLAFLDQQFALDLNGQFTKVVFKQVDAPEPALPTPKPEPKPVTPSPPPQPEPEPLTPPPEPAPLPDPSPTQPEPPAKPAPHPQPEQPSEAESKPTWRYTLKTGPGLGLLVGDIGLANVKISIIKPDGTRAQITSGSKPEYGVGGFETYAQTPGRYIIEFLGQRFQPTLSGKFTKISFQVDETAAPAPKPAPPPLPSPAPETTNWSYTIETGRGLGLLVGDIGVAKVPIFVTRPDGRQAQLMSGSKPEFGIGGFETYAQQPGNYRLAFLDQQFNFTLSGQFTKIIFKRGLQPEKFSAAAVASDEAGDGGVGLLQRAFDFLARLFK